MSVRYEIRNGIIDNVDYNGDGKIDSDDTIVVRYINNKPDQQAVLTKKNEARILKIINDQKLKDQKAIRQSPKVIPNNVVAPQQRIVYHRSPPRDPPPVIIRDDTTFGQNVKNGVGLGIGVTVGQAAVHGIVGVLGSMFSD
jgi:hypothetical protein